MRTLGTIAVVLLAAVAATAPASANLIVNGSFESGSLGRLGAGSTDITGWTVTQGDVDYVGLGDWNMSDGVRNVDMEGSTNGAIAQDFSTVPGAQYSVEFDLSGNDYYNTLTKTLRVSAAAGSQQFTHTGPAQYNLPMTLTYVRETFLFTATASVTTLSFASDTYGDPDGYGPVIDNVVVSPVPEPGAAALVSMGGAAVVLGRRRRS